MIGARTFAFAGIFAAIVSAAPSRSEATWMAGEARIVPLAGSRNAYVVDGWAASSCGRVALTLSLDGKPVLEGGTFLRSPAVEQRFPGVPGSRDAGFSARFDLGALTPGDHVAVLVARGCGLDKELSHASLTLAPRMPAWRASAILMLVLAAAPLAAGALLSRLVPATTDWRETPVLLGAAWGLGALAILAGARIGPLEVAPLAAPFAALANWDGNWYLDVARDGYANPRSFAFFPLFALVLRGLGSIPFPVRLAACLVNGVFFALAMRALRRLHPGRDHALLLFAFLPFSFFFGAVYTESLFLACAAGALLAVRDAEGLGAGVLGGLAALTRVTGIATAFFAFASAAPRKGRSAALAFVGPVAGLAVWMLWLRWRTGDALGFLHAVALFGRPSRFEPAALLDRLVEAARSGGALGFCELLSVFAVLIGSAGLLWRRRWAEGLYSAAVVLMPLYTQSTTSLNRYALLAFPALIFLGERVRPRLVGFLLAGEAALLVLWATRFGRGVFAG